jgi:hypothetical protein
MVGLNWIYCECLQALLVWDIGIESLDDGVADVLESEYLV